MFGSNTVYLSVSDVSGTLPITNMSSRPSVYQRNSGVTNIVSVQFVLVPCVT